MARSLRQLSPTLLLPLRGREWLHNLEAARCFQGSSLIKNGTDGVSGGVLSKGGAAMEDVPVETMDESGGENFSNFFPETFLKHSDVIALQG